jgi:hypothetical protein
VLVNLYPKLVAAYLGRGTAYALSGHLPMVRMPPMGIALALLSLADGSSSQCDCGRRRWKSSVRPST